MMDKNTKTFTPTIPVGGKIKTVVGKYVADASQIGTANGKSVEERLNERPAPVPGGGGGGSADADRPATPTTMGYKVLNGSLSFAEQVTEPNTIYEIRDEFDLNKESLTMPLNIVLRFNGGMLKNGYVIGSNTKIDAPLTQIFDNVGFQTLKKEGSGFVREDSEVSIFNNDLVPAEWFGATSKSFWADNPNWVESIDDLTDSSDAINNAIILARRGGGRAVLAGKLYRIDKTVNVKAGTTLIIPNTAAIAPKMSGSGIMPLAYIKKIDINEADSIVLNYSVKVGSVELTRCVFEYKTDDDLEWSSIDLNKIENSKKIINLKSNSKYEGKIKFTTIEGEEFESKHILWTQSIMSNSIYPKEENDFMVDDDARVIALKPNTYIPVKSMKVAIDLNGATGRIEGHGQLIMRFSEYTIGVYIRGQYYNDVDMTLHPYCDIRVIGGNKMQTAPDVTDLFGHGKPSTPTKETHGWYFDMDAKVEYKKELVSEGSYKWSVFRNANPLYNTSMRIDVTQGSEYRLVNMRLKFWDIYGFRGMEMIQKYGWCNDSVWDGTISNKASNYVSFYGTDIAQHDMRKMDFQCGGEQNDASPILYCEAHLIQLGRIWDPGLTKSSYIRYILTKTSNRVTAEWVPSLKYVQDEGKNNFIVENTPNNNDASACVPYRYTNLFDNVSPNYFLGFLDFYQADHFYPNIKDFNATIVRVGYKEGHLPGELFDNSPVTYKTLVDTDKSIFASGWTFCSNNGYEGWTNTSHAYIQIDYDINDCLNDTNTDIYVLLLAGYNKIEYKLNNGPARGGRFERTKLTIPFNDFGHDRGKFNIIFYTKKDAPKQKLRVFSVKLLVDGYDGRFTENMNTIFDSRFGKSSLIPDAAAPGHTYYDTTRSQLLVNKGTSSAQSWEHVASFSKIEHQPSETTIKKLLPNLYHIWGEITSLKVEQLEVVSTNASDMYVIEFTTPKILEKFSLLLPSNIKWVNGKKLGSPDMPIGGATTYQINIVNNLATWGGFK